MSNALTTTDFSQLCTSSALQVPDAMYAKMATAGGFLRRLTLYGKQDVVLKGLIKPGNFGFPIGEDEITDLGNSVDLLPLARRTKAIDMSGKNVVEVFDPTSDAWKDIQHRADTTKNSKCMYGVSILAIERRTGEFCEWYAGSATTRRDVGKFYAALPQPKDGEKEGRGPTPVTMKSKFIESGEYTWFGPVTSACSTPFTNLPSMEIMVEQVNKFLNPKTTTVEVAEDGDAQEDDR